MKIPLSLKLILGALIIFLLLFIIFQAKTATDSVAPTTIFWSVSAIDTMKYSRDRAQDQDTTNSISSYVSEIANLHPQYIAIDTPYDEDFSPVLHLWVNAARREHLKVWFRGNFSSWEGWFGYKKMTDISQHHILTQKFISDHPELFQDGDIFSPVPEAENGGLGDPRQNGKADEFNTFLQDSYDTCTSAFQKINKKVDCGYFSVNGDIAKQILTEETVTHIGNRIVIDHYVASPEQMGADLDYLHKKFPQAKIVLGEFGAPIPDINGNMSDEEQAAFVKSLLDVFVQKRSFVEGMNYWTFLGSSTALFTDNNQPKPVAHILASYYKPPVVTGRVIDTLGYGVEGAEILNADGILTTTNAKGYFALLGVPTSNVDISIVKHGYALKKDTITISENTNKLQDIQIIPDNINWIYEITQFIHSL